MREEKFPETRWLKNIRYVSDGAIVTTSGVTAAIPCSLALVGAIAGHERAAAVAAEIGVAEWSTTHRSDVFHLSTRRIFTTVTNFLCFWSHEKIGVPVSPGIDEIALALTVDTYSRTFRSQATTVGSSNEPVCSRGGLVILPDQVVGDAHPPDRMLPQFDASPAVSTLDRALADLATSYGRATSSWVAVQLEYPQP